MSGRTPTILPVVGFVGMTHLGIVSASATSAKGFRTICYDSDVDLVERLAQGKLPVNEPGLEELVYANRQRQGFTSDIARLIECDIIYISTDVPTDDQGRSDLTAISALIETVGIVRGATALLIVLCQVPPGFTRALTCVPHDYLFYQVETLVFGRAVTRALHPERYIIGCADPSKPLEPHFAALLSAFGCPLLPMRYESAELAKIAINCCLVSSISVANTLAELCENIGAEWSEIVPALKLDARIGQYSYLAPGLGIAGGNLERDLATIISLSDRHQTNSDVVRAWISNSRYRRDWAVRTLRSALLTRQPKATVAVWGLAYKENTHSTKNSPSLATIGALPEVNFVAHDPVVSLKSIAHANLRQTPNPLDALTEADALMIPTPWPLYKEISVQDIALALRGRVVLDPYRLLDPKAVRAARLDYYSLGTMHQSGQEAG